MARNWTPEQQNAIYARGTLLVSAAAGSGKTAVLTERVISRITDPENPVDADRFLVVTFTRAAAAEMRARIDARLRELIRKNPVNYFLQRQLMLLQQAEICTIDSFFSGLVRENSERLGIPRNLRTADDAMLSGMISRTLEELLEEQFIKKDPAFLALASSFSDEDDKSLTKEILHLYHKLRSLPHPFTWMDRQLERYRNPEPLSQSAWGKRLMDAAEESLRRGYQALGRAVDAASEDEVLEKAYTPALKDSMKDFSRVMDILKKRVWDEAESAVHTIEFGRFGRAKDCDPDLKAKVTALRDSAKVEVKNIGKLLCCTEQEYLGDMAAQAPLIETLFSLTKEFWTRLSEEKNALGVADFADFSYYALQLTTDENDQPTPFAAEYSERYEEILLDEYQDTNRLQDLIFHSVSHHGENLFLVGDLKQSIYRFRSASPEVFMEKNDLFSPFDGKNFPAVIHLSSNFRSRKAITEAVNFVFSRMMSRNTGDVDYTDDEKLNCGAVWYPELPENQTEVSLMLLDIGKDTESEETRLLAEARAAAAKIEKMIQGGELVTDGDSLRPCRSSDFAILLRSGQEAAEIYAAALKEHGINALMSASEGYFSSREVSLMLSLLRALDNPSQDISMAAVLLSPVFGFSCDEVAALSAGYPDQSLYGALIRQSECKGAAAVRAGAFLKLFSGLREKSAVLSIQQLIQYIYDTTDFVEVINRFSDALTREANLKLLLKYAGDYTAGGNSELSGFVGYLDALIEQGKDFEVANPVSEAENSVRIMTIHRSKGLEFPIVFLANCCKKHNFQDLTTAVAIDAEEGFGMKRVERDLLRSFPTLPLQAVRTRQRKDSLSEEMRLLYVAMTRARERLVLICSSETMEKYLPSLANRFERDGSFPQAGVSQGTSYADWILPALLQHPACREIRREYNLDIPEAAADFKMEVCWTRRREDVPEAPAPRPPCQPDPDMMNTLRERFAWKYPYMDDTETPAKTAVTRISHPDLVPHLDPPAFAQESNAAPTVRGSIFHRALQFADFEKGAQDPEAELQRLIDGEWISPAEAELIDRNEFADFFRTPLMERMRNADQVLREYRFFDTIDASSAGFSGSGKVLIQGIADCILIEDGKAVIIDFKTDRVSRIEYLRDRYSSQLHFYRHALQDAFPGGVSECILYSTRLRQTISV